MLFYCIKYWSKSYNNHCIADHNHESWLVESYLIFIFSYFLSVKGSPRFTSTCLGSWGKVTGRGFHPTTSSSSTSQTVRTFTSESGRIYFLTSYLYISTCPWLNHHLLCAVFIQILFSWLVQQQHFLSRPSLRRVQRHGGSCDRRLCDGLPVLSGWCCHLPALLHCNRTMSQDHKCRIFKSGI